MTTARLGIEITSTGAAKASGDLDRLGKEAKQAETAVDRLGKNAEADFGRITVGAQKTTASITRLSTVTKGGAGGIQNVAFQVGDFATQVGAGTSATIALGQQLPQLLGGFGALGAVLGAVVAIGVPLTAALFRMAGAGGDLNKTIDNLNDAMDAYVAASDNANQANADLVSSFGAYTGQVRETLAIQKELAKLSAVDELQRAGDLISETFGRLDQTIGRLAEESGITPFTRIVEKLRFELGATEPQAVSLANELVSIGKASSIEDQVRGYRNIREQIIEVVGGVDKLNDENRQLIRAILDAETATIGLTDEADSAGDAFERTVASVRGLTDEIQRAVKASASLSESGAFSLTKAEIERRFRTDDVAKAGALAGAQYDERVGDVSATDPILRDTLAAERARVISEAKEAARIRKEIADLNEADREIDKPARTSPSRKPQVSDAEKQREALERVNEALRIETELIGKNDSVRRAAQEARRAGVAINSDEGKAILQSVQAIDQMTEALERTRRTEELAADTSADFFEDIISGSKNAGEAIRDLASQFGSILINKGFQQIFSGFGSTSAGGLFGSIFGNANGNAFQAGNVIPFANGGVVNSPQMFPMAGNRTGLMGEAGPEAIIPLSRGRDGKLGVKSEGATKLDVTINVTGTTGRAEIAQAVADGLKQVPQIMQNHQVRYG